MKQYLELLQAIMLSGNDRGSRAGATRSIFGYQMRIDLRKGFPLLTTKKLSFRNIAVELCWFLKGDTNIRYLLRNGCHIWSADALRFYRSRFKKMYGQNDSAYANVQDFEDRILTDHVFAREWGDLGPIYGRQWRQWVGAGNVVTDQITALINGIKANPEGRRHIITAWNPSELDAMALPPCHCMCQFYVNEGRLSCQLYQRSADTILGVPYNIASYALLTHIVASQCDLAVGELVHTFGDVHIYRDHFDAAVEQLSRQPKELPKLVINADGKNDPKDYEPEHFQLMGYDPHPKLVNEAKLLVGA